MKVEVAVLASGVTNKPTVFMDVKQHLTNLTYCTTKQRAYRSSV